MKKVVSFMLSWSLCLVMTISAMAASVEVVDTVEGGNNLTVTISDVISQETLKDAEGKDVTLYTIAPDTTLTSVYHGDQSPELYGFTLTPAKREDDKIFVEQNPSDGRQSVVLRGNVAIADSEDAGYWYLGVKYKDSEIKGYFVCVSGDYEAPVTSTGFTDVAADAYYSGAVSWAVEKGITSGTTATTFSPNNTCTKAQILTFLWRANGSPEPGIENCFEDVAENAYYYKAAVWAYEKGLIMDRWFEGNTPCTRIETVTYLWTLAGRPVGSSAASFTDLSDEAESVQAVAWAVEKGITAGTSATTFSPNATCTRGQIVTFLNRAMAL